MSLWDVAQQMQLRGVRGSQIASDRENHLRDQRQDARVDELEDRLSQALLLVEALWGVCRDRLGVSDDQLRVALQAAIDEREAERAAGPLRCPSCGAACPRDLPKCQYCGAETGVTQGLFG